MVEACGAAIRVERLSVRYPEAHNHALQDVSLEISKGERFALLGPSGSGKSTLLRVIAGFIRPRREGKWWNLRKRGPMMSGRVLFNGVDVSSREPQRRNIAMVRQSWDLLPHLNVWDNLALPLRLQAVDRAVAEKRIRSVLEQLELLPLAEKHPEALSGGEIQRVAIGRLLVRLDAQAYLFDECLNSLDPILRGRLVHEILDLLRTRRMTTLWVTHVAEEARLLADRVGVMYDGHVVQIGTIAEIDAAPASLVVFRLMTGQAPGSVLSIDPTGDALGSLPLATPRVTSGVDVAVQPGGWVLDDQGPFAGTVVSCVTAGFRHYSIMVDVDGWMAEVACEEPISVQQLVHLSIKESHVRYFDRNTGQRVAPTQR